MVSLSLCLQLELVSDTVKADTGFYGFHVIFRPKVVPWEGDSLTFLNVQEKFRNHPDSILQMNSSILERIRLTKSEYAPLPLFSDLNTIQQHGCLAHALIRDFQLGYIPGQNIIHLDLCIILLEPSNLRNLIKEKNVKMQETEQISREMNSKRLCTQGC